MSDRQKSPKYPNISLDEAIERVRRVFDLDRTSPLDREVVAKHMGYSGLSGASEKLLGSIVQYGLLERTGKGEIRVSQRALNIFHPESAAQKSEALREAAFAPETFQMLRNRFGHAAPSREAMRSALVRMQYFDRAIDPIIKAYLETLLYLEQQNAGESDGQAQPTSEESPSVPPIGGPLNKAPSPMETVSAPAPAKIQAGMRHAVLPIPAGDVTIIFPSDLDAQGYEDLSDYFELFIKQQKRRHKEMAQKTFDEADSALTAPKGADD